MLRSQIEFDDPSMEWFRRGSPYSDPALKSDTPGLKWLVNKLNAASLITFRRARRETVGVFCVYMKGDRQRLVFDCRWSNAHLEKPLGLGWPPRAA